MQRNKRNLLDQLNNLILIVDLIPLQKNFILGYILKDSNFNPSMIKQLIRVIELILEVQACQMISQSHVLELIVVFSHVCEDLNQHKIASVMAFYEESVQGIINYSDYLRNKYFHSIGKIINNNNKIEEFKLVVRDIQHMSLERSKSDISECPVCLVEIQHCHVCILGCGHIIHQECFQQCMKESILNKKFPLKCPFEQCKKHIQTQDIQEYLPKELIDKYYEFTLHNFVQKNTKSMSWCPTAGCSFAFEFDENISNFDCAKCKKSYCLKCKTQAHYDKTCEQNQQSLIVPEEDKQFIEFAKGARYKQCPECRFWVQKNHGCCHMTCRCQYQFCYRCGTKYGECNCESEYENYYGSDDEGSEIEDDNNDDQMYIFEREAMQRQEIEQKTELQAEQQEKLKFEQEINANPIQRIIQRISSEFHQKK